MSEPRRGVPEFQPYWWGTANAPPAPPAPPPPPKRSNGPVIALVACLSAVVVLLGGAGMAVWYAGSDDEEPVKRAGPALAPSPPPVQSSPETTPTIPTIPPARGKKGPVAGPAYAKGEDTYHMKLRGFPFEFDAPGKWGCMRSDKAPFSVRWLCIDEGGTFPPSGSAAGGFVAIRKCSPCDGQQRVKLREAFVVDAKDWRKTDSTTAYAEVRGEVKGKQVVRVAMSHFFASKKGGEPDMQVAVQITGPVDQKATMQKLINEIRSRT